MTNRYQPVGGEHRPIAPDSARYVSRGSHMGRGGPFPHWYRGYPSGRFQRGRPIRRRGHPYQPRDVYGHLSEGDWRRDKHASSRNYSGRHLHIYDHYRQKHGEKRPLSSAVVKSPGYERSRENEWYQMYGPQRNQALSYQQQNVRPLSEIDFSTDDTAWESLRIGGAATGESTRDPGTARSTSKPSTPHSNRNGNCEANYEANSGILDSNSELSNNCSDTKDTTDSVNREKIPNSSAEIDLNGSKDFPEKENGIDTGEDKVRLDRDNPTFSANAEKENSYGLGSKRYQNSSLTTERLAAPKSSPGESVPENIHSVLSKQPVVKLTRLSACQLLKYSILNPSSNNVAITSTETVPKSEVPKTNSASGEGTETPSEILTKHTFSPWRNDAQRNLDGCGTNSCGVTDQDLGSSSLTVDPKVMPMSLVLHTSPGAMRAEDKVFTPTKHRTSFSEKGPVKKTHVGHVDINKLKERLREAMASRNSHIMKKFSLHTAKNETKRSPADLPRESENPDGAGSECELKVHSEDSPPSLEPESECVDQNEALPIPDLTTNPQEASSQHTDSQNDEDPSTPNANDEKARNYEAESPRRPESVTVSLEDACKACEALVDYVPKVVVVNGPGGSVVSVSSEENVRVCSAEDTIGDTQNNDGVSSNTDRQAIPSPNSASMSLDQKAGEDTHTTEFQTVSLNSSNLDAAEAESLEELDSNNSNAVVPASEDVDTIDDKAENPPDLEDSSFTANSASVENITDNNTSGENVSASGIIEQTTCDQMNDTLVSEGTGGEMTGDSSDSFRDAEGEQSAVDAAEGLLCLAKSGVKIFGAEEECKDTEQKLFKPVSDDGACGIPVQQSREFSEEPLITDVVENTLSVQQSDENLSNSVDTGPAMNKLQVAPNSLQTSVPSSSLAVTQQSALPLAQMPTTPPEGHGNGTPSHTTIPPSTILVLGPLQLPKKNSHKVKKTRSKMVRDNVLRPLLPKTNGSDCEQRAETEAVLSACNPTVATNQPDAKVLEPESELLDLSVKTRSPTESPMTTSGLGDWKSDSGQSTRSKPQGDARTDICDLSAQYQSPMQTGGPKSTSPGSLLEKNSLKSGTPLSAGLTEIRPETLQHEGEISKDRLKVLISNLRETLGKKMPLHSMNLRTTSFADGDSPSVEGDPLRQEGSFTEDPPKPTRKAKRATRFPANSVRKNKARRSGVKRKTRRRNVRGATNNNIATTKAKVCRRRTPKANVVVKDFYTRLRAKTEGKRNREQLEGRKQNRRQASKGRGVKENETECLVDQIPEMLEVNHALQATDNKFEEEGDLVIDQNPNTMELTHQMSQQADLSDAVDMTVKRKLSQSKQRKVDGRRKKKGRRNHLLSSLEEYKKKLGCEDTDDLPTILPPKRRRTQTKTSQPSKTAMEDPLDGNISRLAREFPRHNWLENKIKNIAAGQKTSSDTNSSPSPVPTTPNATSPLLQSALTDAKPAPKSNDDCPPPLTPIGSDSPTDVTALDTPKTDQSQPSQSTTDTSRDLPEEQRSGPLEHEDRRRDGQANGEEFASGSLEKVPFTAAVGRIIQQAMQGTDSDVQGDERPETTNSNTDERLTGQSGDISARPQKGTPAVSVNIGSVSVTGAADGKPERQSGTENSDGTSDLAVSEAVNKSDGSDDSSILSNSNRHAQEGSEVESLHTGKNLLSHCALTARETSVPLSREGEPGGVSVQPRSDDDPQVPLNLSVKPLDSTRQYQKDFPVDMSNVIQSQNTEVSEPLVDTMKNGPPVLKVLPQVKQVVNSSQEEFVSSVKNAMRGSAELIQTLSTSQAPSSQCEQNVEHQSRDRVPVPPVPALVPLSVSASKWLPSDHCASNESQKKPSVHSLGQWTDRRIETSGDSETMRSASADSVAAVGGTNSMPFVLRHQKRSSLNGGESDFNGEPSLQDLRFSSPPSTELQMLIREFKGLEKKAEEMEKQLKKVLSLRKQKKEELVHYMRQRLGVSRNTDSQCGELSLQPDEQSRDADWMDVFQVRTPLSSSAEYSENPFHSANRNNNNDYNAPVLSLTPVSDRLRRSSGDPSSCVASENVKDSRSTSSMLRPSGKRHKPSTGMDLSAKRRVVSSQVSPPQAHSNSSVDSVWTMMDIPVIKASKSSVANCPYVQSSTLEIPESLKASNQSLSAHPAHSQKPFETAGVIITAQPDGHSQRPHVTHITEKNHGNIPIKSGTIQQTNGGLQGPQINEPNPCRPSGALQDRPSQFYSSGPTFVGQTDAVHMKLPVASPTKPSSSSEQPNTAATGYSEPTRPMLEYVDLRQSPENIVRRVPLPPGIHFGPYPSEKISQTAPFRAHGLPASVQQNSQLQQHRTSMTSEKEQNVQRELVATVEKQRRSKLHDQDSLQPRMVPWSPTSHPGVLARRPDGAPYYPQGTSSGLMAPHLATSQGKNQPPGSVVYTMPPFPAQVRPARPMLPGNQASLNTTHPFSDKPPFVAPGQKEHNRSHDQFVSHPRGTPVQYTHPASAEAVMAGRGGVPASSSGHHPPQLVQALVSPPMRPRISHFIPPQHRMPDARGLGQGQTFFKAGDTQNPPMRPPNAYRPEGSFHPQRYPHHNVPIQQFTVPNSSAVRARMPSPNNEQVRGKFVELPRRSNPNDRSPGYLTDQHGNDRSAIHTASAGLQLHAIGHPANQSPQQQQQHSRHVSQNPSQQGIVRPGALNHGHPQEHPEHQGLTHLLVGHHTSAQQTHVPQSSAHQTATHPFADRQPSNPQLANRARGHVSSHPKSGESGQKRSGSRSTDFNCAECNRKANMICSRCESVRYCSRECQIKGWHEHGQHCKPRTSAR